MGNTKEHRTGLQEEIRLCGSPWDLVAPAGKGSSTQIQGLTLHEATRAVPQGYPCVQLRSG